jgi:hypothetical protein
VLSAPDGVSQALGRDRPIRHTIRRSQMRELRIQKAARSVDVSMAAPEQQVRDRGAHAEQTPPISSL